MHTKILVETGAGMVPLVAVIERWGSFGELRARDVHWNATNKDPADDATSWVQVTPGLFQVVLGGIAIATDDVDPRPPAGWDHAVERNEGRCVVLTASDSAVQDINEIAGLFNSGVGYWAVVDVRRDGLPADVFVEL